MSRASSSQLGEPAQSDIGTKEPSTEVRVAIPYTTYDKMKKSLVTSRTLRLQVHTLQEKVKELEHKLHKNNTSASEEDSANISEIEGSGSLGPTTSFPQKAEIKNASATIRDSLNEKKELLSFPPTLRDEAVKPPGDPPLTFNDSKKDETKSTLTNRWYYIGFV